MTTPDGYCVTCAQRGRDTEAHAGLLCAPCAQRVLDDLDAVPRLAAAATTQLRHGHGTGRSVPASRPPIDLAGVDPALTLVAVAPRPAEPVPLLVVVEGWVRVVREERRLAAYGPWSAAAGRTAAPGSDPTLAVLAACTALLRAHHDWVVAQPWVDAYAAELGACHRALLRWDLDTERAAPVVLCPSERPGSVEPCGGRIRLDQVTRCPRCGRHWDRDQLVRAASASPQAAEVWVDVEAAAAATGVPVRTIQRWATMHRVRRAQGRYAIADIQRHA